MRFKSGEYVGYLSVPVSSFVLTMHDETFFSVFIWAGVNMTVKLNA